jgi:hypothetical protein
MSCVGYDLCPFVHVKCGHYVELFFAMTLASHCVYVGESHIPLQVLDSHHFDECEVSATDVHARRRTSGFPLGLGGAKLAARLA